MNKSTIALCAALAVFGILFASLAGIQADENTAAAFEGTTGSGSTTGDDSLNQYGEPTVIEIAPDFKWTYTMKFPDDVSGYTSASFLVNTDGIAKLGTDNRTLTAQIPTGTAVGKVYDIVVEASMTGPVSQTAHQYIQLKVISGLAVSGTIGNIIKGTSIDFTPQGSSSMGTVTWSVNGTLPAGLSFDGTRLTGTPTTLGENTVSLKATAAGETKGLDITFKVFSKMNSATDETIKAFGSSASSKTISNPSDLDVAWKVTSGTLPSGFTLDAGTGSVSGYNQNAQRTTVTITGTPTADGCPSQSVSKRITIETEQKLVLTAGSKILTYKGNTDAVTSTISFPSTSKIAWTSGNGSATVSNGVVSVRSPSVVGMDQSITVTAKTEYGQTATVTVPLAVEDTLAADCAGSISAVAGEKATSALTVSGGSSNRFAIASTVPSGMTAGISDTGVLTVSSDSAVQDAVLKITVTSAAGQTVTKTVEVDVYSVLVFTSAPTCGIIAYAL